MNFGFLERLTLQLTIGAAGFPEAIHSLHGSYILNQQRPDGGWAGREGESDLYYTGFALRSLAFLGLLEGEVARSAAGFLQAKLNTHQSWIDLFSLLFGARLIDSSANMNCMENVATDWQSRFEKQLSNLRRSDGGYAKSEEGQLGSTYQTFLIVVLAELFGLTLTSSDELVRFLNGQRQADGGFLEIRVAKRSGTNPTAAAIAALSSLNAMTPEIAEAASGFLADLQTDEGGFQANTRMPLPDVLSTFTASTTLWELDQLSQVDLDAACDYVLSMQRPQGGFAGFELDPAEDVEYTFYGLGTLALACASGVSLDQRAQGPKPITKNPGTRLA